MFWALEQRRKAASRKHGLRAILTAAPKPKRNSKLGWTAHIEDKWRCGLVLQSQLVSCGMGEP